MTSTIHQTLLKTSANIAAADTNCTAVALTERPAAFVSFQRLAPDLPAEQKRAFGGITGASRLSIQRE